MTGDEPNVLDCGPMNYRFTKPYEVLNLMLRTDIGILDNHCLRALEIGSQDRLIAVSRVSIENGVIPIPPDLAV